MNKKLKARIVLKFETQWDFAEAIGEQPAVVSHVIRGRRNISDIKKVEWAMKLGCRPEDIFDDWYEANRAD